MESKFISEEAPLGPVTNASVMAGVGLLSALPLVTIAPEIVQKFKKFHPEIPAGNRVLEFTKSNKLAAVLFAAPVAITVGMGIAGYASGLKETKAWSERARNQKGYQPQASSEIAL